MFTSPLRAYLAPVNIWLTGHRRGRRHGMEHSLLGLHVVKSEEQPEVDEDLRQARESRVQQREWLHQ